MQFQRSKHDDKRKHPRGRLGLRWEQHPNKYVTQMEEGTSEETKEEEEQLCEDTQMERICL
jgi:hypothetical protein